jgi:rhomboid protease GluP
MDLQIFLALSAASFSAVTIGQMVIAEGYRIAGSARMFAMHGLVILVAVAGYWLLPDIYGYLTCLALLAIYAPGLALGRANRALLAGRNVEAARLARLAALLHPAPPIRFTARLFTALAQPTRETRIEALETLKKTVPPDLGVLVDLQILRQRDDWHGMVDFLRRTRIPAVADALTFPIRALGETGQLEAMVQTYSSHRATFGSTSLPPLMVLAFCGRVDAVLALLPLLRILPPAAKFYWQAVALQAAGRPGEARHLLAGIDLASLPESQRSMIASRLETPTAEATPLLSPGARHVVDALEARIRRDAPLQQGKWRRTPLTYLLIAANCVMFGVESVYGDTTNAYDLFRLGALQPDAVIQDHEWWRLGTAMFLHAGPEHLISNMLALWILGRFVELSLGTWRTAVIYGLGGLISMAGVIGLTEAGITESEVLVGASGAIFALLGAIALRRLTDFLTTRHISDRRNLTLIGMVLVLQAAIDLALPQISFAAHGVGLVAGVVLGWLLTPKRRMGT